MDNKSVSKSNNKILHPKNWPSNIEYINIMKYPKNIPKKLFIKNVKIKLINDENHICNGEYGLYAINKIKKFQILGEYTGKITSTGGRYVAGFKNLEYTNNFGVDAQDSGNELRFINDYRNINTKPNTILENTYIDKRPKILVIATDDIDEDEELLLDYGTGYYNSFIKK